MQKPECVV